MSRTLMQKSIPFIEARNMGKKQRPKTILLRLSETTFASGAAMGIANYWNASDSPIESCHYVVDEELTFQCVPDSVTAFSSRFDTKGIISINVCATPTFGHTDWKDAGRSAVVERTAMLTARLVKEHKLPVRYIDLITHRRFLTRGGIMNDVRGSWPRDIFLDMVRDFKSDI